MSGIVVRAARIADAERLASIYNHYVTHTHISFDLVPVTPADREAWVRAHPGGPHVALVACETDAVVGFASSAPWRPRPAYAPSVETSVYLDPSACGRGIGSMLYDELLRCVAAGGAHRAYAVVAIPNDGSVALHERFGFRRAGYFTEQGRKFDRWWDVAVYEKPIDGH